MKKITTVLFSLLFFQLVNAQQDTLLIHYRQEALDYQQYIKMAEHQLSGAESKADAVKSDRLPQLDFNSNYSFYGMPMQLAPSDGSSIGDETHNFYSLNLDLYQPILTGGKLKNQKMAAETEVEMMKSYVGMSRQQIVLNSDIKYWNSVSKKEMYNLYAKYKGYIGQFLKVISDRVEEEIVGRNELYQAQVRYDDAEYKEIRSRKEYTISIMNLNKMIGVDVNNPTKVADSLSVILWSKATDTITKTALSQRPEMSYVQNQIIKNQYNEKIIGSQYNPQLGVRLRGKWGAPSPGLQINPDFNYNIKAQLSIPIYHWGKKHKDIFAAQQQTEISKLQMEETKDKITLEIESSYYKLERSQEQLNFANSSLDNSAKNVSVMLDRYNEGLSSVLEVLDAQLYWQKTYLNYIIAKYELNVAYSQYQYAIGDLSKL